MKYVHSTAYNYRPGHRLPWHSSATSAAQGTLHVQHVVLHMREVPLPRSSPADIGVATRTEAGEGGQDAAELPARPGNACAGSARVTAAPCMPQERRTYIVGLSAPACRAPVTSSGSCQASSLHQYDAHAVTKSLQVTSTLHRQNSVIPPCSQC